MVALSSGGELHWAAGVPHHGTRSGAGALAAGQGTDWVYVVLPTEKQGAASNETRGFAVVKLTSSAACAGIQDGADYLCPMGHYCPAGMRSVDDGRCPRGSYSNKTGLHSIEQCSTCPPGMYCSDTGLTAPTGICSEGYTRLNPEPSPNS